MNNVATAKDATPPVMVLTIETNSIEGTNVSTYTFTQENVTQEQLQAFITQLSFLLAIMGRPSIWSKQRT